MSTWKEERDKSLSKKTEEAHVLVGKKIQSALVTYHNEECDGENVLRLVFTDNTTIDIVGDYGGYSGRSCDEYVEFIGLSELRKVE
jgi:adenylate cyclase